MVLLSVFVLYENKHSRSNHLYFSLTQSFAHAQTIVHCFTLAGRGGILVRGKNFFARHPASQSDRPRDGVCHDPRRALGNADGGMDASPAGRGVRAGHL